MKALQMAVALLALILTRPADAAELVMLDDRACVYCRQFHREVGRDYSNTGAGETAPLRKVNRWRKWPEDLGAVAPAYFTPVFILVDEGREVGRFAGYTTE